MIGRDQRAASFERSLGHVPGHSDGEDKGHMYTDRPYITPDSRETEATAQQWIVMANALDSGSAQAEFLRSIDRQGRRVWTLDARAAASVLSFETEQEAGIYIAGKFSARQIDQYGIQPTAFYPLAKGGDHGKA